MVKWSSKFIKTDLRKMNLPTDRFNLGETKPTNRSVLSYGDEPTNRPVQSMPPRDVTLPTDQVNLFIGGLRRVYIQTDSTSVDLEDKPTNRPVQS